MGWIHHDASEQLLAKAGLTLPSVKQLALRSDFKAIPLNLTADLLLKTEIEHRWHECT